MATNKYQLPSPYVTASPLQPTEDEVYYRHLDDLKLESPKQNTKYGVAIFGVGRAGTIHLRNILNNRRLDLLYIVEDEEDRLEKIEKYYCLDPKSVRLISGKQSSLVYSDPKVRFVVVSTPTDTHEAIIDQALKHNKAVFCEKPISSDVGVTVKLFALARQVNQPLFSAFNRRFDPSYANIRKRVRAGEVGKVLTVKVCNRDAPMPSLEFLKISSGVFYDAFVHDVDLVLYSLGELPDKVVSFSHATVPEIKALGDYDNVSVLLSFPSGTNGIIDLCRQCSYGNEQRLEVFGEKGMLKAENRAALGNVELYTLEAVSKGPIDYSFPSRYKEAYERELQHFVDVLDGTATILVTEKTTMAVSKIATAVEESARTGKIVQLRWTADEAIE
ncbi:uncharacterized protein LOC115890997 [Sitophilus oryzae]|uniref:Uncharacterized protein LOC115890997 n=1 Tax=Sitophilus oryzae TaxID=7048 RepID=A0A6J2YWJ9_SITOR|nr:uncharacterized protein LOC115890997 [Sitophilus oryzae]